MKLIAALIVIGFVSAGTIELPGLPSTVTKDCVICPQVVPECGPCPTGQKCLVLPQTCKSCALAICHPHLDDALMKKLGQLVDAVTTETKWPETFPTGCIPSELPVETLINPIDIPDITSFLTKTPIKGGSGTGIA